MEEEYKLNLQKKYNTTSVKVIPKKGKIIDKDITDFNTLLYDLGVLDDYLNLLQVRNIM